MRVDVVDYFGDLGFKVRTQECLDLGGGRYHRLWLIHGIPETQDVSSEELGARTMKGEQCGATCVSTAKSIVPDGFRSRVA